MYLSHFGFTEYPFSITPDTGYVFSATAHQEALNTLLVAIESGEGFVKITGEIGTGKTLLCRRFLTNLGAKGAVTAYIPNPQIEPRTLMLAIAEELNIPHERLDVQFQLLKYLNIALLDLARQGKRVIVCIDEAQAIPLESLETLRLLSNLETEKTKLIQVVLFGQPELDEKLADPSVRQLRQRIAFEYRLQGLPPQEVGHYVAHRLRVAGYRGNQELFTRSAMRRLHKASGGTPRVLNILAHKSLLAAFGEGSQVVSGKHVLQAANDSSGIARPLRWWS